MDVGASRLESLRVLRGMGCRCLMVEPDACVLDAAARARVDVATSAQQAMLWLRGNRMGHVVI